MQIQALISRYQNGQLLSLRGFTRSRRLQFYALLRQSTLIILFSLMISLQLLTLLLQSQSVGLLAFAQLLQLRALRFQLLDMRLLLLTQRL